MEGDTKFVGGHIGYNLTCLDLLTVGNLRRAGGSDMLVQYKPDSVYGSRVRDKLEVAFVFRQTQPYQELSYRWADPFTGFANLYWLLVIWIWSISFLHLVLEKLHHSAGRELYRASPHPAQVAMAA